MKEKLKYWMSKKSFHISVISIIIVILLFILGVTVLKYSVEGEKNMPFIISKISILSSVEGVDKENAEHRWDFDINQNNDIYLYIEKNSEYDKIEAIQSIVLDNFQFQRNIESGETKIFRLDGADTENILKTKLENQTDRIEFKGEEISNIKQSKIANQGGLVVFRCSNYQIGNYISDEEEINHSQLLQKAGIVNEDLKVNFSFDITLQLQSGKEFKATVSLTVPIDDIVNSGMTSIEKTDLNTIIFKRTKN